MLDDLLLLGAKYFGSEKKELMEGKALRFSGGSLTDGARLPPDNR